MLSAVTGTRAAEPACRDLFSDTWVATDALGRTMPDDSAVGPVKQDQRRVVGIFYIAWHSDSLAGMKQPYAADVTKVLASDPRRRLDAKHPAVDRRLVPLGRTGIWLFPQQRSVCDSQRHVHARGRWRGRVGDGCDQRRPVLGRVGRHLPGDAAR